VNTMKLKRVYHPYDLWEEIKYNMWGSPYDSQALSMAITFIGNHMLYGQWMIKVVNDWPISCENAFTNDSLNKKAWLGHAAVAYAMQIPESITRKAWGFLTYEQRILANKKATNAIAVWYDNYTRNKEVHKNMGEQMLFEWDT
jgi:hypothetical protein